MKLIWSINFLKRVIRVIPETDLINRKAPVSFFFKIMILLSSLTSFMLDDAKMLMIKIFNV